MNSTVIHHFMKTISRLGIRPSGYGTLALTACVILCGAAISAFGDGNPSSLTHNPKQTVQPGATPSSAQIALESVSAKLSDDGSEVKLDVNISEDPKNSGAFAAGPAKLEVENSDGKKLDPPLSITQSGETKDLSFNRDDLPGCKYKVTLVADLWGTDKKGTPKDVTLDDCKGGSGGSGNQSVMFEYGLGVVNNGNDGGVLKVESEKPSADLYSPKSITVNLDSQYITRDSNGIFQKAVTDDTITTITNVVENQGYTINFANSSGTTFKTVTISNPGSTVIANTQDQKLFQEERWGASPFSYEIPIPNGKYKVQLYFAELYLDHAGAGVFNVTAEGNTILSNYDSFQAAGGMNTAKIEEASAVVQDGGLSLGFNPVTFGAHVSAIKVLADDSTIIAGTTDQSIYQTARQGDFSWQASVPNGNYNVTLLFDETTCTASGQRVFNVSAQGIQVLANYDIYAKAGTNAAWTATFPATVTNGTINLQFTGVTGQARVCGIEVKDATTSSVIAATNAGGSAYTAADSTAFTADSGFTGGNEDYDGKLVAAINCGSSEDYTANDGTVFTADTHYTGGKAYAVVFNRLRLTEQEGTSNPRISEFSWLLDPQTGEFSECDLSRAGGLQVEGKQESWSSDRLSYDEIRTIKDSTGHIASKTVHTYQSFPFGFAEVKEVQDPDGAAITTNWAYETGTGIPGDPLPAGYGEIKQMTRSDGYWEQYSYDTDGRRVKTVSQYLNSSLGAEAASKVETSIYSTVNPVETHVTTIKGVEVARTYVAEFDTTGQTERWDITCTKPGAAWDDSSNLTSKTCRYSSDYSNAFLRGRAKWSTSTDNVLTTYNYTQSGTNLITTCDHGAGSGGTVTAGTRTVTATNLSGEAIDESTIDIASGLTLASWSAADVDGQGRVTKKSYADGTTESITYVGSAPGCTACTGSHDLIESETSREGIVTTYQYDDLGRCTDTTRLGITKHNTYDAMGRVLKRERIGTDGSAMTLEEAHYDDVGRVDWRKDPMGNQTNISYSTDGLTTTTIAPDSGTRIEVAYPDGHIKSISGTAVAPMNYAYGSWNSAATGGEWTQEIKVGENGSQTEWVKTYNDLAGHLVKTEYPDGAVATRIYNNFGQIVRETDPDKLTTLHAYDAQGNLAVTGVDLNDNGQIDYNGTDRITRALREVVSESGTVVTRTTTEQWAQNGADSASIISRDEEDGYGNQSWHTDAAGQTTSTMRTLQGAGNWTTTASHPDGSQTIQTYQNGMLASEVLKDSHGNTLQSTGYGYDPHGRVNSQTDGRNGTTNLAYDNADRLSTKSEPSADGTATRQLTQYFYNATGQLTETILPDNSETHNDYYPTGALQDTYGSQNYTASYTYDPQGRMKTLTTGPVSNNAYGTTTWIYDSQRGWLLTKQDNSGRQTNYSYTSAARLKTRKWARNVTTTYNYTSGDLTGIVYSDTTPSVTYGYDRLGERSSIEDASGTRSIDYNANGDIATEKYTAGLLTGLSIVRNFDTQLRRSGLALKDGATTLHSDTFGYGESSRLASITAGSESVEYGYLTNSPFVATVTFKHNGSTVMTTTKSYDLIDRLTEIKSIVGSSTVSDIQYKYTSLDQRNRMDLAGGDHWEYQYDAAGEVINGTHFDSNGIAIGSQNFGYNYDGAGNRQTTNIDGTNEVTYTSSGLNQYAEINGGNEISPVYDEDGNLTDDGNRVMTYDAENRLTAVKDYNGAVLATYVYDDQGRRVRKTTTAQAVQGAQDRVFLWDGWNIIAEMDYTASTGSFNPVRYYDWGLDLSAEPQGAGGVGGLVMEADGSNAYYPSYDGNGNLVDLVLASDGSTVASYAYDPFGNQLSSSGAYANSNPWRFSTKFYDSETTFLEYQLRYYRSDWGRWINRDPIVDIFPISLAHKMSQNDMANLYNFLGNNVIDGYDYLGMTFSGTYSISSQKLHLTDSSRKKGWFRKGNITCECDGSSGDNNVDHIALSQDNNGVSGPIPTGDYTVYDRGTQGGMYRFVLDPNDSKKLNDQWDGRPDGITRNAFRLHAEDSSQPNNGSQGCIVTKESDLQSITHFIDGTQKGGQAHIVQEKTVKNPIDFNATEVGTLTVSP